jgi:hypothetical protein
MMGINIPNLWVFNINNEYLSRMDAVHYKRRVRLLAYVCPSKNTNQRILTELRAPGHSVVQHENHCIQLQKVSWSDHTDVILCALLFDK